MAAPCICKVPVKSLASLEGSHPSSVSLRLGLLTYPAVCWWRRMPGAQGMWMGLWNPGLQWDLWIFSPHAEAKVSGAEQFWRDQSAQIKAVLGQGGEWVLAAICFRRACGISCPGGSIGTRVQVKHRLLFPKANNLILGKLCFTQLFEPNRKSVVFLLWY